MAMRFKNTIKSTALRVFPDLALRLFSIRSRRIIESQARALKLDELARRVSRATGGKVAGGPFSGMRLDYEAFPVHGSPKYLGTYERELHSAIERMVELGPRFVLNIGCAEGFYAVGLAIRLDGACVFAADADPKALRATMKNAELNGVLDRVSSVGIVRPGQLSRYLKADGSLLVMDCEGAEFDLLDPGNDPILLRTNIVVEVHPEFGDARQIVRRFAQTHKISEFRPIGREALDIQVSPINGIDLLKAADERTGDKAWLCLEAKFLDSCADASPPNAERERGS